MKRISTPSPLVYVLKGLMPYSHENLLLAFKPKLFFAELAKISNHSESALRAAFYRAQQHKLIDDGVIPRLTVLGRQELQPFIAQHLANNAELVVIFDIPEVIADIRRQFRLLLRNLEFRQVQQSVWATRYDYRGVIKEAIKELDLTDYVQMYEAVKLFPG